MKKLTQIALAALSFAALLFVPGSKAAPNSVAAFDLLKSLVGHWQEATPTDSKANMDIELTANGTAVLERFHMIESGKAVEMTTLYYLDGDQLKMTHYCMAGNQPTMRASYAPDTKTLTFDFESATNLKSPNDGHMHHAVYTFPDKDRIQTRWTFQKDQKDAFSEDVTYVRTK
jgi:hypothetical protein